MSGAGATAPGITDHALVRWLERSGALDIEQLRAMLAASLVRAYDAAASIGGGRFLIVADGLVYVVQDGNVTTVLNDDGRHARMLGRAQ